MNSQEVREWRALYVLSRAQLAGMLGCDKKTVERWELGTTPPPRWLPLALETIAGHRKHIANRLRAQRDRKLMDRAHTKGLKVAL